MEPEYWLEEDAFFTIRPLEEEENRPRVDRLEGCPIPAEAEGPAQAALAGTSIVLGLQDKDLRYVWVANAPAPMSPVPAAEEWELVSMRPEVRQRLAVLKRQVMESGQAMRMSGWIVMPDGHRFEGFAHFSPHAFPDGTVGVWTQIADTGRLGNPSGDPQVQGLIANALHQSTRALAELEEKTREVHRQLEEAREAQFAMLPKGVPMHDVFDLAANMETCERVGGDYYDYLKVDDEGIVVALGDATGHGVKGGIVVSAVRSYFQLCAERTEPQRLLEIISEAIRGMNLH